jgi:hypothetical protein
MSTVDNTSTPKLTRTRAFRRDFAGFEGSIKFVPTQEIANLGVQPVTFNAAEIAGFAALPASARIILSRAIADQLAYAFSDTLRPSKDYPEGRTVEEAVDEMSDLFASIVEGTYTYGRTSSGDARTQGVALTAALMVAANYGLPDRGAAMAHPHYPVVKQRLQDMLASAAKCDEDADAAGDPETAQTLAEQATQLRSSYRALATDPAVASLRAKWYPPKGKAKATTLADFMATTTA